MLALYAVALHVILLGFAPLGVNAAAVDPFAVICHSQDAAPGDQAPGKPDLLPGHACDHCTLCSASAAPPPPAIALTVLGPTRVLHALRPFSTPPRASLTAEHQRARGPPLFA